MYPSILLLTVLTFISPVTSYQTWLSFKIEQFEISPNCIHNWAEHLNCMNPALSLKANLGNSETYISNSWSLDQVMLHKGQKYTVQWDEEIEDVTIWMAITGVDQIVQDTPRIQCSGAKEVKIELSKDLRGSQAIRTDCFTLKIEFINHATDPNSPKTQLQIITDNIHAKISFEVLTLITVSLISLIIISSIICCCCFCCRRSKTTDIESAATSFTYLERPPTRGSRWKSPIKKTIISPMLNSTFQESIANNTLPYIHVSEDEHGVSISI